MEVLMRLAVLGLLAMAGCAPQVQSNAILLTPANAIALQDGTPIVRLIGYKGNPRATVSFIFANGVTFLGDAIMNADVNNSMGIWGQVPQPGSSISTIAMVAINETQNVECEGSFSPNATDLTCRFSDGAIYRNVYTAPVHAQPAAPGTASSKA
jgi:hypothetical protein